MPAEILRNWRGRRTGRCSLFVAAVTLGLAPAVAQAQLAAAVLPTSRSVAVGATATAFATIINAGSATATGCQIAPSTAIPATFVYQTTNPTTNAVTGTANTPVSIAAGGLQTFVIAFTPTAAFASTDVALNFTCTGLDPAPSLSGINTLLLTASFSATADIVALAATTTNNGVLSLPSANGAAAFAVATVNLGAADTITVSADTGPVSLPVSIAICQTNPATGVCLVTATPTVTATIAAGATPTFGIFVAGTNNIAPLYGANRMFVHFTNSQGNSVGATGVAVNTKGYNPPLPPATPGTPPGGTVGQMYTGTSPLFSFCTPTPTSNTSPCPPAGSSPGNPSGGNPPYHFQLDSGSGFPPIGMFLGKDGLLTGTPAAAGTSNFRVCAVDLNGSQVCVNTSVTIQPATSLVNHVVTGVRPQSCTPPTPKSTFRNTDAEVDYWILLSNVTAGSTLNWQWYKPNGNLYLSDTTNILVNGTFCFWDTMYISGYTPAVTPVIGPSACCTMESRSLAKNSISPRPQDSALGTAGQMHAAPAIQTQIVPAPPAAGSSTFQRRSAVRPPDSASVARIERSEIRARNALQRLVCGPLPSSLLKSF
jgi:hypothetical protein